MNTYISLYGSSTEDEGEETGLVETIADRTGLNPEELFLDKERMDYLEKAIMEELSEFEKQVFDLFFYSLFEVLKMMKSAISS